MRWRAAFVGLVSAAAAASCAPAVDRPLDGRLLVTSASVELAWLRSGLYSLDTSEGTLRATLQRIDPNTGDVEVVPWPEAPCEQVEYFSLSGQDERLYIARLCNPISGQLANDYVTYDPARKAWSTLVPASWVEPPAGPLAWDEAAQEGLFTNLSVSCSSVFRLTPAGPSFVEQVLPTSAGDVDTRAGLSLEPLNGGCLRDGRAYGISVNERNQLAMMVSPVSGPAGPGREGAEIVLVVATWNPGADEPLSDVRSVVDGLRFASPPAWSADGTGLFWSSVDGGVEWVDVVTGKRSSVSDNPTSQVVASPDGTRLALRRGVSFEEGKARVEIRILDLPPLADSDGA